MSMNNQAEQRLLSLVNELIEHHAQRSTENMVALFAQDGEVHYWGTGIDEEGDDLGALQHQFQRDFNEVSHVKIEPVDTKLFCTDKSGVVVGNWKIVYQLNGSNDTETLQVRATIYADGSSGEWKIRHAHWSVAYGDQPVGRSFPNPEVEVKVETQH